ncbi:glycosyltransferase [Streptomyces sp. NPDC088387]|uniref:glycosyltransferase n=1 Tax=Streptomyces sp. NPDC088387 TaxID=3365859 RepID=UPI0037F1E3CC
MSKFLWACFDGGGNVPPSIGIARALGRLGHEVVFAGRATLLDRVRRAGFRALELTRAQDLQEAYRWHPRGAVLSYLTSPVVAEELLEIAAAEHPEAVVIDAHFSAALAVAPRFGVPTATMLHSFLHRTYDGMSALLRMQSDVRERSGYGPLPGIDELWGERDVLHANALAEFDRPRRAPWPHLTHGGPVLEDDSRVQDLDLPWPGNDTAPLVVVSFSTEEGQGSVAKLQRTLDALADLPVHVVTTTSGVDPALLRVPNNAHAVRFASHDALMRRAAAVVTHGGHGTAMRALSHGAPLLLLVGQAADQPGVAALDQSIVAAFVDEIGAGITVGVDADPGEIRAAVQKLLTDDDCRLQAARAARSLKAVDGARTAALRLAQLVGGSRSDACAAPRTRDDTLHR